MTGEKEIILRTMKAIWGVTEKTAGFLLRITMY